MELSQIAREIAESIGPGFVARSPYRFAVPRNGGLSEEVADAVLFSRPVPSIQTAAIGFVDASLGAWNADALTDLFYLGAPLLVARAGGRLKLFEFRGSPVPYELDQQADATEQPVQWLRGRISRAATAQLSLQLTGGRDLALGQTWTVLSQRVHELMTEAMGRANLDELDAFRVAIAVFRYLVFQEEPPTTLSEAGAVVTKELAEEYRATVSFANLPPESVAELYESLAVSVDERRRNGVVYTPAWLARYVVERLPRLALEARAFDPACGSGTFLVSFLERMIEEAALAGRAVSADQLTASVIGYDIDPVAIEAARLALDFFAISFHDTVLQWDLNVADTTSSLVEGEWLIGNLPFGYRSYKGKGDLSSAILENILARNPGLRGMSVILPDSWGYTKVAAGSRRLLRDNFLIEEITRLPESTFATSTARTMSVAARAGKGAQDVLVREVTNADIRGYRVGQYISTTYVARLPNVDTDPWRLSPFSNELEFAEQNGMPLGELAEVWIGLQVYGAEDAALSYTKRKSGKPLLMDPKDFLRFGPRTIAELPRLIGGRDDVRRPGPWDRMNEPKIIVRATTAVEADDRLAAIADTLGAWFTDKFIGIWPASDGPGIHALAAYLQTRIVRIWFDSNNPSRKARVRVIEKLPVPMLPVAWWERAANLAVSNVCTRAPNVSNHEQSLIPDPHNADWEWFNRAVETAFGISTASSTRISQWLARSDNDGRTAPRAFAKAHG